MQETWVRLLGGEDALEKEMANTFQSSCRKIAWTGAWQAIPWAFRVRCDLATTQRQSDCKTVGLQKALNAFFNKNYLKKNTGASF